MATLIERVESLVEKLEVIEKRLDEQLTGQRKILLFDWNVIVYLPDGRIKIHYDSILEPIPLFHHEADACIIYESKEAFDALPKVFIG